MTDNKRALVERLQRFVDAIGVDLSEKVTLVGGTAPALHDGAEIPIRMTDDIDVVVRGGFRAWRECLDELEAKRFHPSREEGAPICRYVHGDLVVDVMTTEPTLGFTNKWYAKAVEARQSTAIKGLHVISPLYFLATKFEAFESRGKADPQASHDLEDIVVVLRRDKQLFELIAHGTEPVHEALRHHLQEFVAHPYAGDFVQGHLEPDDASQRQGKRILERMKAAATGAVVDDADLSRRK